MGQSRLDFQRELRKHAPAAHYMRPAGNKMDYPCFVYKSIEPRQIRADNRNYLTIPGYEVLYISETENEGIVEEMTAAFPFCSAGAPYIADDLFHYPFTIYY
jgi:hypothetical protein